MWYPRLAHITPRTIFIPLRKSEAAAIKAYASILSWWHSLMSKLIARLCNRYHDYTWRAAANTLSPASITSIRELASYIEDAIRNNGWHRLICVVLSHLFYDDAFASGPAASCGCAAEAPRTASLSTDKRCGMITSALYKAWLATYLAAPLSSMSPQLTPTRD